MSYSRDLKTDINKFCRNLRLKEYFHTDPLDSTIDDNDTPIVEENLVRNKSNFTPPSGRNQNLDKYISFLKKIPLQQDTPKRHPNITKGEYAALKDIQSNKLIVIKQADKGGAMVTMDKDYYKTKIMEIIGNQDNYKEVDKSIDNNVMRKVKLLITKHNQELTPQEADYVTNFEWKTSNFYGLPKVHKNKTIMDKCNDSDQSCIHVPQPIVLEMRPIVAGPMCATHRLSNLLDIILKPMTVNLKSHIKDSTDFLNKLPTNIPNNSLLVTFDVTNLYGSIPHTLGLEAIRFWLNKHPESINNRFSHDFVIQGIKLILENNIFQFNDKYYQQTKGTAMGTKIGPTYATLVMGYLEDQLYKKIIEDKGVIIGQRFIELWKRFLDDCFTIWYLDDGPIDYLIEALNSLHPDIHFTVNASKIEVPFLDIKIIKKDDNIVTDIYHKPTDTKNYLLFSSHHPRHVKISLPYSLALRIIRIVSDENQRKLRLKELERDLLKRRYPKSIIKTGLDKAIAHNRLELLKPKNVTPTDTHILPVVTTNNPHNTNLFNVVSNTISTLNRDVTFKSILPNLKLINSKRQPPRLSNLLIRAKFTDNNKNRHTVTKCAEKRCGTCSVILQGSEYTLKSTGETIKVKEDFDCKATYVIYIIKCLGCGHDYIGSTNNLRHRVALHKSHIKNPENSICPVSGHLRDCSEGKFKIFPFVKIHSNNSRDLLYIEQGLIRKHKPSLNG